MVIHAKIFRRPSIEEIESIQHFIPNEFTRCPVKYCVVDHDTSRSPTVSNIQYAILRQAVYTQNLALGNDAVDILRNYIYQGCQEVFCIENQI
jgi:hypothetical protein